MYLRFAIMLSVPVQLLSRVFEIMDVVSFRATSPNLRGGMSLLTMVYCLCTILLQIIDSLHNHLINCVAVVIYFKGEGEEEGAEENSEVAQENE